jgi:hypothetical protein
VQVSQRPCLAVRGVSRDVCLLFARQVTEWTCSLLDDCVELVDSALDAAKAEDRDGGAAAGPSGAGAGGDAALAAKLPSFGEQPKRGPDPYTLGVPALWQSHAQHASCVAHAAAHRESRRSPDRVPPRRRLCGARHPRPGAPPRSLCGHPAAGSLRTSAR